MSFPRKERKNKDGPGWDYDTLGEYTMDGRISSLLGRHPLLVDFYNFCSLSMMSEFLDLGDMEQSAQNYEDRCVHEPVRLSAKAKLASYNNYTGIQKLSYALDMAEGVALLHNHPLGVIVHDDIQLGQFLLGHDGHVKFNDFNRGVIMMYDEKEGAYCKYNMNGKGPGDVSFVMIILANSGSSEAIRIINTHSNIRLLLYSFFRQWRTPEEYRDDLLDQQSKSTN